MRLEIPSDVHPPLSKLIQQCWDEDPNLRPSFSEITVELEGMLPHPQVKLTSFSPSRTLAMLRSGDKWLVL